MRSAKAQWVQISYKGRDFEFPGTALARAWPALHRGDREPWPDEARVSALYRAHPQAAKALGGKLDAAAISAGLIEAWRAFHRGDYAAAWTQGATLDVLGALVAAKAAAVYTTYLEPDDARALAMLEEASALVGRAAAVAPGVANAHYFHAYALGRLSQRISIVKALAAGHATRIRQCLETTLRLEPAHADALIAFGLYHAEIVGKVGALAARLTYRASAASAIEHFKAAQQLDPLSSIARMEYANGLLAMHGERAQDEAIALYQQAAQLKPRDAMQWLDIEQARAELD